MNIYNILSNVIAGLITTITISFFSYLCKVLKSNYKKDKFLFAINFVFYFNVAILTFTSILFGMSYSLILKIIYGLDITINVLTLHSIYKTAKGYIHYSSKNS